MPNRELFEYLTFFHRGHPKPATWIVPEWAVHPVATPSLDPQMAMKLSDELGRALEDYIVTIVGSWDDVRQATAYLWLNKSGMTLERAHQIRVKAGLSD